MQINLGKSKKTVWRMITEFIQRMPHKEYFMTELAETAINKNIRLSHNLKLYFNTKNSQVHKFSVYFTLQSSLKGVSASFGEYFYDK